MNKDKPRIIVVASNYSVAKQWAEQHNFDRSEIIYPSRPEKIKGLHNLPYVVVDGYRKELRNELELNHVNWTDKFLV